MARCSAARRPASAPGRAHSTPAPKPRAARTQAASRAHFLQHLPLPVHALVVGAELALLDRAPPLLVRAVPLDGLADAVRERDLRLPAGQPRELARIDRVAPVVPGAVLDVTDERARLAEQLENRAGDGEHVELVLRPDVERLALDP